MFLLIEIGFFSVRPNLDLTKIWSADPLYDRKDISVLKKIHHLELLTCKPQFKLAFSKYLIYLMVTSRCYAKYTFFNDLKRYV